MAIGPFTTTGAVLTILTLYMILAPAKSVMGFMQLTEMSLGYEFFLILLGVAYVATSWGFEKYFSLRLARFIGNTRQRMTGVSKKRKEYKIILESARV